MRRVKKGQACVVALFEGGGELHLPAFVRFMEAGRRAGRSTAPIPAADRRRWQGLHPLKPVVGGFFARYVACAAEPGRVL
jgi:hypothetical protein